MTILRDAALAVTAWTVLARLFWPSLDGAVLLLEAVLERVWPAAPLPHPERAASPSTRLQEAGVSCFDYDDPDRRVVALNRRARLLHDIAHNPTVLPSLRGPLHEEALAVADEAALLVAWYGAKHGEAYYHGQYEGEDPEQLCEGWAVPDGEVAVPKVKTVPVKDEAL